MTRTQKTVFILVALIALVLGLTINKVLSGKGQGDPTALIDAAACGRPAPPVSSKGPAPKSTTSTTVAPMATPNWFH